ncbi:glutaminase [Serratia ureilytica]
MPADRLAIAVCTVDGELFQAGDAAERFSIQSISKVLSSTLALTRYQEPGDWRRASARAFRPAVQPLLQLEMEQGKPRNCRHPGAGGATCCKIPPSAPNSGCWRWRQLAGEDDLAYDLRVARARVRTPGSQCGHRLSDEVVRKLRKTT